MFTRKFNESGRIKKSASTLSKGFFRCQTTNFPSNLTNANRHHNNPPWWWPDCFFSQRVSILCSMSIRNRAGEWESLLLGIEPVHCGVCQKGLYRNSTLLKGGWSRCSICEQFVHYSCLASGKVSYLKRRPRVCQSCDTTSRNNFSAQSSPRASVTKPAPWTTAFHFPHRWSLASFPLGFYFLFWPQSFVPLVDSMVQATSWQVFTLGHEPVV